MQASQIPTKYPVAFAVNALAAYIRSIPQSTVDPNAASLNLGFPPNTFVPQAGGGEPPDGRDFNGLFNLESLWSQWFSAGGPIKYDSAFQTAIGGYPQGAVVQSTVTLGLFWFCLVDNNTTNPDTGGAGWANLFGTLVPGIGAQLNYVSGSTLQLSPKVGGLLWINGSNYAVPANLTLSNAGLVASTKYYIYDYMNSGAMVLEASLTGYTAASNGIPQKTGDVTRTLVGMAYTDGSGNFQSGVLTLSYFNRRDLVSTINTTNLSTAALSPTDLGSAAHLPFLTWPDEAVIAEVDGYGGNNGGFGMATSIGFDGNAPDGGLANSQGTLGSTAASITCARFASGLSEGFHYSAVYGQNTAGTGTWQNIFTKINVRG